MCKNKKLRESLDALLKSAYSIFDKEIHLEEDSQIQHLYTSLALHKLEVRIKEIPEFNVCMDLMKQDEKIKALQGKLVGTSLGSATVSNEETCILSFINQIYFESKSYNHEIFYKKYLSFEELFYSEYLGYIDTAKLYNFSFENNEILLSSEISIKRVIKPIKPKEDYIERMSRPNIMFSESPFVIERIYRKKKRIGVATDDDQAKINAELSETGDLFDLVINSLRLLKTSGVYRSHQIKIENTTFHPYNGTTIRSPFFENVAVGEECKIDLNETTNLQNIFNFVCAENDSRFKVALRRLSLGNERKNLEDKLIDFMIGLEALYLPDGNAELSFRLSVRVAFLLFSGSEKKDTYIFLRKIYDVRSSIVHGNKYELNNDEIIRLEGLLRKSLNLWIDDKSNFSITKKNKSGKVITEGKLDTMLFDV